MNLGIFWNTKICHELAQGQLAKECLKALNKSGTAVHFSAELAQILHMKS